MIINPKIFRAYDIRGKYPNEINEEIISSIISSFISKFKIQNLKLKIIITHDARLSSPSIYKATQKLLKAKSYKLKTISIGLSTTPMFYFLAHYFNVDLGIMITASHNPKEYNGLKIVGKKAMPISGEDIFRIMNKEI